MEAHATRAVVSFAGPLDFAGSLSFLLRNGDDGLDRWDGRRWTRTLATATRSIAFSCTPAGTPSAPRMAVDVADRRDLAAVQEAARQSFLLPGRGFRALLGRDSRLARLERRFRGVCQVRQFDLFYGLLRVISAQQINLRWAGVLRRRLAEVHGERLRVGDSEVYSLRPEVVAGLGLSDLRALQYSTHKAQAVLAVAEALATRRLTLEGLAELSDADAMAALVALRGIGPWSAEWILVRCLGRARVVAGDLGVRKAVALAYLGKRLAGEATVRRATARWGPHSTAAQAILLRALAEGALDERL